MIKFKWWSSLSKSARLFLQNILELAHAIIHLAKSTARSSIIDNSLSNWILHSTSNKRIAYNCIWYNCNMKVPNLAYYRIYTEEYIQWKSTHSIMDHYRVSDWTSSTSIDVCNIKQKLKQHNICFRLFLAHLFHRYNFKVKSSAFPQPSCEISLPIRLELAYIKLPTGAISLFLWSLQCNIYDSDA